MSKLSTITFPGFHSFISLRVFEGLGPNAETRLPKRWKNKAPKFDIPIFIKHCHFLALLFWYFDALISALWTSSGLKCTIVPMFFLFRYFIVFFDFYTKLLFYHRAIPLRLTNSTNLFYTAINIWCLDNFARYLSHNVNLKSNFKPMLKYT